MTRTPPRPPLEGSYLDRLAPLCITFIALLPIAGSRPNRLPWSLHITLCLPLPFKFIQISSVQFSSVSQSCPTLCDPMNRSTPGLPVHHHLPEFTQTHVHRVGDAIQSSHPLSSPFPPAPNPSQHQSLFQ